VRRFFVSTAPIPAQRSSFRYSTQLRLDRLAVVKRSPNWQNFTALLGCFTVAPPLGTWNVVTNLKVLRF
jgi:hypothetical protein